MPKTVFVTKKDVNNHNIFKLAPFRFADNRVILDRKFYNEVVNSWFYDELEKLYAIDVADNVCYGSSEPSSDFYNVYRLHLSWHNACFWYDVIDSSYVVIDNKSREVLKEISNRLMIKSEINDEEIEDLGDFYKELDKKIKMYSDGAFVKTAQCSTKHDFRPQKVFNAKQCIEHLFSSKKINNNLNSDRDKDFGILITEWNDNIDKNTEFRLFIENGKVIGISQQYLYAENSVMLNYWSRYPEKIYESCQNMWDKIYEKLKEKFRYKTLSVDVWIDEDFTCHLIEINGAGQWGPAGASLYEWIKDPPDSESLELRIKKD